MRPVTMRLRIRRVGEAPRTSKRKARRGGPSSCFDRSVGRASAPLFRDQRRR
jgi:hypothetical protein